MPPAESQVLTNYLIQPSSLTSILTFEQFQALFPPSLHASDGLRSLFRDLRAQRKAVLAQVSQNIADEVTRGNVMRKEVVKARRGAAAADEDPDGEVELERAVRFKPLFFIRVSCDYRMDTLLTVVRSSSATNPARPRHDILSAPLSLSWKAPRAHSRLTFRSSKMRRQS